MPKDALGRRSRKPRASDVPEDEDDISALRSFHEGRSDSIDGPSLSAFEQMLPQDVERLQSHVPKSMKCALSAKLGGVITNSKYRDDTGKVYTCVVEPRGRKKMIKEILRYGDTACPEQGPMPELPESIKFEHAVMDAIVSERHDRSVFRTERLRKFNVHRFVPALVSERLVPCWRCADSGAKAEALSPAALAQAKLQAALEQMKDMHDKSAKRARKYHKTDRRQYKTGSLVKMNCIIPTMSTALKRTERHEPEEPGWSICSVSEAKELLKTAVQDDSGGAGPAWDELREQKMREFRESKELWLAHDVKPGGRTTSLAAEETKEVRLDSRLRLDSLNIQYEKKRERYQNAKHGSAQESFQKYFDEQRAKAKAEAEEAAKVAAERKKDAAKVDSLAGVLSLGLSKSRAPGTEVDTAISGSYHTAVDAPK